MAKKAGGVRLFLQLTLLYAAVFAGRALWFRWVRAVHLAAAQAVYYHYDFIGVALWTRDSSLNERWRWAPPRVRVRRGGQDVATVAQIKEVRLGFDPASGAWKGKWPCPWNAPAGSYELELRDNPDLAQRLETKPFRIAYRRPRPLPRGFSVVTLESVAPFRTMRVPTPSGEQKDWRGLLDWVEYVGADAFWILGGQTPGAKPGELWVGDNLSYIPKIARECHRRGIKFGVYVMCYLTMSAKNTVPRYEYALEVKDARTVRTRAISIRDPRRVADVAELLEKFRDIPEVDYLGIDYIRNALGGYELVDDFFADMPGVRPPPGWERLSREDRMVYFARKKIMRRDMAFIDAWQWWRSRKVAGIVRQLKARLGGKKPLWSFTLTWDKGWQHGQDPVMMNDAGVDVDALMLYEATGPQFDALLKDWNGYVKRSDAQLIVGDVIDWPLHQKNPSGPKEFYRRMVLAVDRVYSDGPASGVFFHDLSRALWGRTGPWGTRAWMDEARRVVRHMKEVSKDVAVR